MSLSGFLIVLVGLSISGLTPGPSSCSTASVKSGFMNLLYLVYIPPCIVLRLYDLPSLTGHCLICAGVHIFLSGSS